MIHEKLYKGDELATLDLALYIDELFSDLVRVNDVGDRITHTTHIDNDLVLDLHTMVPLGLLLNELITNSFKHAFKGREHGDIHLSIKGLKDSTYDLIYSDDGVGIPLDKINSDGSTLGVSLIESLVEQLSGHMTVDGSAVGTNYHIRFKARM